MLHKLSSFLCTFLHWLAKVLYVHHLNFLHHNLNLNESYSLSQLTELPAIKNLFKVQLTEKCYDFI